MLLEKSLTPAWVSFHGAPQPARRPVLGVRPHRRRSLRRLRRGSSSTALGFVQGRPVPFHTDTERPVRSGGPNGRLPCTLHAPLQTPERPSLTRRDRCGESRGWGRGPAGEPSGAGIICVRKPILPVVFYTLLLHRWEAVSDGPRPGRRGSRRSRRHGPIALHCRRAVRPSAAEARRPTASATRVVAVHRTPATRPPTTGWLPLALNAHDSTRA